MREPALPSLFLGELPDEHIQGDIPGRGGAALRHSQHLNRLTRVDREDQQKVQLGGEPGLASNAVRKRNSGPTSNKKWAVGDKLVHTSFGVGDVTHTFGNGERMSIAVKFPGMGPKILDPRLAPIKPHTTD